MLAPNAMAVKQDVRNQNVNPNGSKRWDLPIWSHSRTWTNKRGCPSRPFGVERVQRAILSRPAGSPCCQEFHHYSALGCIRWRRNACVWPFTDGTAKQVSFPTQLLGLPSLIPTEQRTISCCFGDLQKVTEYLIDALDFKWFQYFDFSVGPKGMWD